MNQQLNTKNTSAIKIQSVARRHLVKQQLKKEAAAIKIQSVARGYLDRQLVKAKLERAKILKNQENCPISLEPLDDANSSVTRCKHVISTDSLLQSLNVKPECPLCRRDIKHIDLINDQLIIKNFKSVIQIAENVLANEKPFFLFYVCRELLKIGDIDRAFDIAISIPNDDTKSVALSDICQKILKSEDIDRAFDIAISIPNDVTKSFALDDISKKYLENHDIDRAFDIAISIPNDDKKSFALRDIYQKHLENHDIDRAFDIAISIPNDDTKTFALHDICTKILKSKDIDRAFDIDRALDIADTINNVDKSWALDNISITAAKTGKFERALEIANSIPDEFDYKSETLSKIRRLQNP